MNLSTNFTLEEAVMSQTAARLGIDNSAPEVILPVLQRTATKLEKVRALSGKPISVSSWYRCLALNEALKSKPTSQHIKGEAVDFISPEFGTPLDVCRLIIANVDLIRYDQLILEHTWVHISWNSNPAGIQRSQVLSLLATGGYANGLTTSSGESYGA